MRRSDRIVIGAWLAALVVWAGYCVHWNSLDHEGEGFVTSRYLCREAAEQIVLNRRPGGDGRKLATYEARYSQFCPPGYGLPTLP